MGAVFIFILLALLWVVLIVPRQREVRRHKALMASLEVGDDVMTGSGIYGTIIRIADDDVWIDIAPGVTIKMARRAIGSKIEPDPAPTDADSGATPIADEPAELDAGLDRAQTERTED